MQEFIIKNGRKLYKTECKNCGSFVFRRKCQIKKHAFSVCSQACFNEIHNHHTKKKCSKCGKEIMVQRNVVKKSKSGRNFCNQSCAVSFNNKTTKRKARFLIYEYRKTAFESYEIKCNRCGYDKYKSVLQVHHKDRNSKNGDPKNLEVLCPTCHMEEHYLNKDGFFTPRTNVL